MDLLPLRENLLSHLHQIVRERSPYLSTGGHFYVQQYIQHQLSQWGNVEIHKFQVGGEVYQNLILNLPAAGGRRDEIAPSKNNARQAPILIGAHYDAVPGSPGADDNATGVAVLLELARAFSQQPISYPVRLVAFDMEEYGLLGSAAYAAELWQQKQPLRLMLSLEMLGYCDDAPGSQNYPVPLLKWLYPDRGNFLALIGNAIAIPDLLRLNHRIRKAGVPCEWLPVPNRGSILPDTRRSDHAPFWDRGYRAVLVTDTANLRNPHYHQPSDRIDTLNLDFLTSVCQGLIYGISKETNLIY
jgi:Zn-dependent M28 family amino/carboxypeptidase